MEQSSKGWKHNKTIAIAWLIFIFPVGLLVLWKGDAFDKPMKIKLTGLVVAVVLLFIMMDQNSVRDMLRLFILCPAVIYFLWKDSSVAKTTTYGFVGGLAILFVIFLSGFGGGILPEPDCVDLQTNNGCTYFRDSNCVVIGQQCS